VAKSAALLTIALSCLFAACSARLVNPGTPAIDSTLARCIPPDAALIAGIDFGSVRQSPLFAKLPANASGFAGQFQGVTTALVAYTGSQLLVAARGNFPSAPADAAVMLAPDLALYGVPEDAARAAAQFHSGRTPTSPLLSQAQAIAPRAQIWIASRGSLSLPLTGNIATAAQILQRAQFVTITARTSPGLALELRAMAPDETAARAIEETLRADFTLAAAGEAKRPVAASALRAIQVSRAANQVAVSLTLSDDAAARLLALL
jgi:hypothetical protein